MSNNTIGFYEALPKFIFQLSSKIIKYAPYLFSCLYTDFFSYMDLYTEPDSVNGFINIF